MTSSPPRGPPPMSSHWGFKLHKLQGRGEGGEGVKENKPSVDSIQFGEEINLKK